MFHFLETREKCFLGLLNENKIKCLSHNERTFYRDQQSARTMQISDFTFEENEIEMSIEYDNTQSMSNDVKYDQSVSNESDFDELIDEDFSDDERIFSLNDNDYTYEIRKKV